MFISVTTIPAAADIGVSLAFGSAKEALGSLEQLLLNVILLAAVAAVGLPAQRAIWHLCAFHANATHVMSPLSGKLLDRGEIDHRVRE